MASGFEILFALGLKYAEGFTRLGWSVLTVAAGVTSFLILSQALRTLPVGTGYAVWTGIGAVGATILGIFLFHEPRDAGRLVSIGLIISGIVGLRLTSATGVERQSHHGGEILGFRASNSVCGMMTCAPFFSRSSWYGRSWFRV
jgi:quaternary ammonium compound-resistance protein SugE